jgi:hypothetical protein
MSYEEAQQAVEILREYRIPARILTYGLPKTSLGFKVDAAGGKFYELDDLKNHLRVKASAFSDAADSVFEASRAIQRKGIRETQS